MAPRTMVFYPSSCRYDPDLQRALSAGSYLNLDVSSVVVSGINHLHTEQFIADTRSWTSEFAIRDQNGLFATSGCVCVRLKSSCEIVRVRPTVLYRLSPLSRAFDPTNCRKFAKNWPAYGLRGSSLLLVRLS